MKETGKGTERKKGIHVKRIIYKERKGMRRKTIEEKNTEKGPRMRKGPAIKELATAE